MKTLDEVIAIIDGQQSVFEANGCFNCHHKDVGCLNGCVLVDTVHYLNEYRGTCKQLLDGMKQLEDKEQKFIQDVADLKDNPALSWEELKKMVGEPLWVECRDENESEKWESWCLVYITTKDLHGEDVAILITPDFEKEQLLKKSLGKTWQAYRKVRE